MQKICSRCRIVKDYEGFYKSRNRKYGLHAWCKSCKQATKNLEKCRENQRKRRLADPEKYKETNRKWRLDNREKSRELDRKWRLANPEKRRESERKWVLANLEKRRENHNKWMSRRRREDPAFKILTGLRTRICVALKEGSKSCRTLELLGCSIEFFRSHLESSFQPGMTWENYGPTWHVDHIRPCASFDLSNPAQQKDCFHWSNCQPLFAKENLQKGDKWK